MAIKSKRFGQIELVMVLAAISSFLMIMYFSFVSHSGTSSRQVYGRVPHVEPDIKKVCLDAGGTWSQEGTDSWECVKE